MSIRHVMRGPGALDVIIEGIGDITALMDSYRHGERVPFRLGGIEAEAIVMSFSVDSDVTYGGRLGIVARVELSVVPARIDDPA